MIIILNILFFIWYPLSMKIISSHTQKKKSWYTLGVLFKISAKQQLIYGSSPYG